MNRTMSTALWMALGTLALSIGASPAEAQSCTQPISSTVINAPKEGGTVSFQVNDPNKCGWLVDRGNLPWAGLRTSSGTGSETVTVELLFNRGRARVAIIRAGNHFASVIQAGSIQSGCVYQFSPAVQVVTEIAGRVTVTTTPTCWELAQTETDWIRLTGGQSQAGTHEVAFNALYNPGALPARARSASATPSPLLSRLPRAARRSAR